jgi:hypothetical protein
MSNKYKALNDEHKSQIDDLIDHTILCALREDLEVDMEDCKHDEDSEEYDVELDERHQALDKEALTYLIERLQDLKTQM